MDRRRLIAGNWKMNLTIAEGVELAQSLIGGIGRNDVEVAVFPSFLALPAVAQCLDGSRIKVGAQDVFWKSEGAFTGEVSCTMLADVGCDYCIVGHSERRGRFGVADDSPKGFFAESDITVNFKTVALISAGIHPIVCVGETLAEKVDGNTSSVIGEQLEVSLQGIDLAKIFVAYEPVWAIGTGKVCEPDEAAERSAFIRDFCGDNSLPVLYGGSVKAGNARDLFQHNEIDGALVGGASLDALEFLKIVESA